MVQLAGKSCALIMMIVIVMIAAVGCGDDDKNVNPDNNPPVIVSVTANPDTIFANQSTTVAVVANDPDGDDLHCSWEVHGLEMQAISGTNTSVELQPGCDCLEDPADVQVLAIVTDGNGGEARDSAKVVVLPSE